jgi:hypothetical protein
MPLVVTRFVPAAGNARRLAGNGGGIFNSCRVVAIQRKDGENSRIFFELPGAPSIFQ